ncbi:beta strand repeat-containing protein [Streptomyces angustmyceticus]|uniref:beta strand repeat-containing protein n=1 Tax=Streptomyces angustmyceticus TaxID=285578 RepID=UPI00384F670E
MALALTLTPSSVTTGQTFQAAVTGAVAGELITFTYDAAVPQTAVADLSGNASVTFTGTTSGVVTAAGATSGAATATVTVTTAANCVVTLESTPANPAPGQPVTITATVTCDGTPVQGATVVFATTSGSLGVGVTTALGQATLTTSLLPVGLNVVTATVTAATTTCTCIGVAASVDITVTALSDCVVTVTSSPANPTAGQPVTFTASVTCNGAPVEGATVLFATTSGSLGVGVTTAAGQATLTTNLLPVGPNVVTATVIAATTTCTCIGIAASVNVTVTAPQNCVITLTSSPANPAAGQPVTLTATVTCGGAPVSGATVLFATTSGSLGVGITSAAGTATLTTSLLPAGANVVTATVIAGTSTCTCIGVSATATVNVTAPQNCAITLTSSPANPAAGQPVTLTATVTCGGAPVSGATVLFTTTSGSLGIGTTNAAGQATLTTSALPAGSSVVTATVIAATTTCTCIGTAATATVNVTAPQNCAITLTSTPANPAAGQPVTLTATVTCNGAPVSGATVLFATTNGPLGVGVTTAAGTATLTTSLLPAGANVVTATVIAGTSTCTCVGVAATATVNVGAARRCAVTLTSSPANPAAGQPVTLTATVTCNGVPVPGAVVLFSTTSGPVGIGLTNASGQATVTTTALPAGSTVVTATVLTASPGCNCVGVFGTVTVTVGAGGGTSLTAHPACYRINTPPLPSAFATATFSASGATPGATVTFHLDGAAGPVACTAVADASGNASCTATLTVGQVLFTSYTATSGGASSSSTLSICLT